MEKQEIKLEYAHLCDYAVGALNQKVNIMGIFDVFFTTKAPDFYVAIRISVKEKADYKISFQIKSDTDNEIIFSDNTPSMIPKTVPVLNFNILKQFKGIDFKKMGNYKLIIFVNDLPIGFMSIEVKLPQ